MKTEIVVQLIETSGVVLAPLLGICAAYFMCCHLLRIRKGFDHESALLKEALFYRAVIDKYREYCKEETSSGAEKKRDFWNEVRSELDMSAPSLSTPAKLKERLRELDSMTARIEQVIEKMKP